MKREEVIEKMKEFSEKAEQMSKIIKDSGYPELSMFFLMTFPDERNEEPIYDFSASINDPEPILRSISSLLQLSDGLAILFAACLINSTCCTPHLIEKFGLGFGLIKELAKQKNSKLKEEKHNRQDHGAKMLDDWLKNFPFDSEDLSNEHK